MRQWKPAQTSASETAHPKQRSFQRGQNISADADVAAMAPPTLAWYEAPWRQSSIPLLVDAVYRLWGKLLRVGGRQKGRLFVGAGRPGD